MMERYSKFEIAFGLVSLQMTIKQNHCESFFPPHSFFSVECKSTHSNIFQWDALVFHIFYELRKKSISHWVGPSGLRAPCVLACAMRNLAIVITIVQSFSLFLFLRLLLLTHFGESPVCENLFPPIFWHN